MAIFNSYVSLPEVNRGASPTSPWVKSRWRRGLLRCSSLGPAAECRRRRRCGPWGAGAGQDADVGMCQEGPQGADAPSAEETCVL